MTKTSRTSFTNVALLSSLSGLAFACSGSPGNGKAPAAPTVSDPPAPTVSDPLAPIQPAPFALAGEARAGVDDAGLQELLVRHWDQRMRENPVWAGTMGDHRFNSEIRDHSTEARNRRREQQRNFLADARALDQGPFSDNDKITLALFAEELERTIERNVCEEYQWSVSARGNPVSSANVLPDDHKITDVESANRLVTRYQKIPKAVNDSMANLRIGLTEGRVASVESIQRTIELVRGQLEKPISEWALAKPAHAMRSLEGMDPAERDAIADKLHNLVTGEIKSSFESYLQALESEVLPKGRSGKDVGAHALPDGLACYQASIRGHINLELGAEEIHKLGRQEIQRINKAMTTLGKKLFRTRTLAATVKTLRTNPKLYFRTEEEIVEKAEASLAKAKAAIPEYFGILPKTDCRVVKIPDYDAPYTTIAYYRQPQSGTGKPGEYFVNTFKPETRPRFEMEVLAYHESIPGHHLQIAISQERQDLPLFRRHGGSTAFVEGWALYTERLAEEMGLYTGDLDRMGMLSYDAWRAARLVVDTGIHAMGWTREEAEKFMQEHTALTFANIRNEVDRYISWPGQAVAYKIGQLEILRLRTDARERLGDRFSLPGFHDVVLKSGAVTLPVLANQVDAWVQTELAAQQTSKR